MRVSLGPIKGKRGACLDLQFSKRVPSLWDDEGQWLEPIHVDVRVTNTGRCYLVRGQVSGKAELRCHRCLSPVQTVLHSEIDEEFFPQGKMPMAEDDMWDDDEDSADELDEEEANTFTGDSFDLTEIVNEYCVMALPAKIVCREDCLGLCSMCGHDLNSGPCHCEHDDVDPRLASLKKLLMPDD